MGRLHTWVSWCARIVVAAILIQTLWFKFTGAPESVWIFTTLGVEPWGRYLAGVMELIAGLGLLVPVLAPYAALLALGVGLGAVASHLAILGCVVQGDGGELFGLACIVVAGSSLVVWLHRTMLLRHLPARKSGKRMA